jgi:hypothetical protein
VKLLRRRNDEKEAPGRVGKMFRRGARVESTRRGDDPSNYVARLDRLLDDSVPPIEPETRQPDATRK